jgi:hypothetical protein
VVRENLSKQMLGQQRAFAGPASNYFAAMQVIYYNVWEAL